MTTPIVSLDRVSKTFERRSLWNSKRPLTYAVRDISLDLIKGETLALVGESGSGKSTLGLLAMNLLAPSEGSVSFAGTPLHDAGAEDKARFRRTVQIVFQNPSASFNPRRTVYSTLAQPQLLRGRPSDSELRQRVDELLETVGLTPASAFRDAYSHQLSGGQRQRVMIARALSVDPDFVVADEPLSSLDVTVQAQILDLLMRLKDERGIGYMLITHDLALVAEVADRVAVMYRGRVVESGPAASVCADPQHPYTRLLMASTLSADPSSRRIVTGEPKRLIDVPQNDSAGCSFTNRCPIAVERCTAEVPALEQAGHPGTEVACHVIQRDGSGVTS